jgi:hypothetical protein
MITLQIYSIIISGAIVPEPEFQSALYILYRDYKLNRHFNSAFKITVIIV